MSYNYKQAFWSVIFDISDIGVQNRERLANAAADLQTQTGILIALSAGGRNSQETPEITLVVGIDADINALLSGVKAAVAKAGLDNDVQLCPEIRFHSFSASQLSYIAESITIPPQGSTPNPAPSHAGTPTIPTTNGPVTHDDLSFSILHSRQAVLSDDKAVLRDEFESVRNVFKELSAEIKSSAAVVLMAREGLVTVGMKMWLQFVNGSITGSIITAIEPLISSIGGINDFRAVAATLDTPLSWLSPNV